MAYTEIGALLTELREEAELTQKEMAQRLNLHQSRISRLEGGESNAEIGDYIKYLCALGLEKATCLAEVLEVTWEHLSRPSMKHPNLEVLIEAEEALKRLDEFRQGTSTPHVLAGQADLLFRRLFEFGQFLLSLDHKVVYVGDIGVGKTTAACQQAGLVTDLATSADLKGMILDTGGGRTTLCDVYVQKGDKFAINVEPLADEEVYRLVEELCRAVQQKREKEQPANTSSDYRPPEEIERALRNMAGLTRSTRKKDASPPPDPIMEIGPSSQSIEEFKAEVASRLTLWRRTRRTIEFEGTDLGAGRRWLKSTFAAINNGRHPDFSLPDKITVTVPFSLVSETPFGVTLVDTRGVDGSAIRPDLMNHLKDQRAVTILCSKWGSAPDSHLQDVLKHVTETESDPTLTSRVAVLVLARAGDGLSMRDDSGESVKDPSEGYAIKRVHVEDALGRISLKDIEVTVFDATYDKPVELTNFLISKIDALREAQCSHARTTIRAIDQMLKNVEEAEVLATLESVNNELQIFANSHESLKKRFEPVHLWLLRALRHQHPRTVWAATRRAGSFWNFNVYQHLGDGASADAKRRCDQGIVGLRKIVENKLNNPDFESAHSFLKEILDDVDAWESDFLKAARHHAVTIYRPALSSDKKLWNDCEAMYGSGITGYKVEVASKLKSWFNEQSEFQDKIDRLVERAWKKTVIEPLQIAVGVSDPQ